MSIIETLLAEHPVRKSKAQKEAFRTWIVAKAKEMGYEAQVETIKKNDNVVIGDPETAEVTFTAHYDTPPVMPFPNIVLPKNVPIFLLYQVVAVIPLFIVSMLLGLIVGWITKFPPAAQLTFSISLLAESMLMMLGPANKHNANDNTSGVASVMEIIARLPEGQRSKAAFILFDNEEKGLLGSKAYSRKHKDVKQNKLIINMDCVGDGEHILFFAKKPTRELGSYSLLNSVMEAQPGRSYLMSKLEKSVYPSDQKHFRHGIAVCACRKSKVFGYFCDKIHTPKDTVCDQVNLDFLADGLVKFVAEL